MCIFIYIFRTCEICGATALNVASVQRNEANNVTVSASALAAPVILVEDGTIWHGRRIMNFLLACMVFGFVISWLFHFKILTWVQVWIYTSHPLMPTCPQYLELLWNVYVMHNYKSFCVPFNYTSCNFLKWNSKPVVFISLFIMLRMYTWNTIRQPFSSAEDSSCV